MSRSTSSRPSVPGIIESEVLYSKHELLGRLRWKEHAFRTARRNGLRVLRAGRRAYIYGRDVIAYLSKLNDGGPAND